MKENQTILLVDDDKVFRSRLARAFSERNLCVIDAEDYQSACLLLEGQCFDLAVLDLKMPGESGLSLLRVIRAKHPQTKVSILTGYGTVATAVQALKLGALNYLMKPVDADTILASFGENIAQSTTSIDVPNLSQVEWDHINRVVNDHNGNISKASKALGLHRRSLQRKLSKTPQKLR